MICYARIAASVRYSCRFPLDADGCFGSNRAVPSKYKQ